MDKLLLVGCILTVLVTFPRVLLNVAHCIEKRLDRDIAHYTEKLIDRDLTNYTENRKDKKQSSN